MNYLKSILFLIYIILYYFIVGGFGVKLFHIPRNTVSMKIVVGFILTFFIGFVVGFPLQLISVSWMLYAVIYGLFVITLLVLSIFQTKKEIILLLRRLKAHPKSVVASHIKHHWFVYLLVIVFTLLSVTNTQPYLWNNYHDDYYISKIVHLVGAQNILNENYITGMLLNRTSLFSLAQAQGYRLFNTYELTYSFWGSLFGISLAFFCRFTMVIHNYLMCFMVYKLFAELFVDQKWSQFTLFFFALLMIPAGYAARGAKMPVFIRMYENWRFQTAIFYGGSITRVLAIPLLIIFGYPLIDKLSLKKLLFLLIVMMTLISFQTNGLCYVLFLLPIFIFIKLLNILINHLKKKDMLNICLIAFSLFLVLILLSNHLLMHLPINLSKYETIYKNYIPYYNNVFSYDVFALSAFIPVFLMIILEKDRTKRWIHVLILLAFLIIRLNKSSLYIAMISTNFYGIARIVTSILLVIVGYDGIVLITLVSRWKKSYYMMPACMGILSLALMVTILTKNDTLKSYTATEDNMTPLGYSFQTLTDNDQMLPNPVVKVGQYFNSLSDGHYILISEGHIKYKNTYYDNQAFLFGSKNIALWFDSRDQETNIDYQKILLYLQGKAPFSYVKGVFAYIHCNYIYTTRELVKKDLVSRKCKVVLHDTENNAYLLKVPKNF